MNIRTSRIHPIGGSSVEEPFEELEIAEQLTTPGKKKSG